eukprot:4249834-Pleurochrysis_carterae.AAC.1
MKRRNKTCCHSCMNGISEGGQLVTTLTAPSSSQSAAAAAQASQSSLGRCAASNSVNTPAHLLRSGGHWYSAAAQHWGTRASAC